MEQCSQRVNYREVQFELAPSKDIISYFLMLNGEFGEYKIRPRDRQNLQLKGKPL